MDKRVKREMGWCPFLKKIAPAPFFRGRVERGRVDRKAMGAKSELWLTSNFSHSLTPSYIIEEDGLEVKERTVDREREPKWRGARPSAALPI